MHDSCTIRSVLWKDKHHVLLISTHARPIQAPYEKPVVTAPRRQGATRINIQTSLVLLEYTTDMRGVDVADQLRASYSAQVRSHKWWHRIFFFLLDMTVVNMYIIYVECVKNLWVPRLPMTHLQFKMGLCEALLEGWSMRDLYPPDLPALPNRPVICTPSYTTIRCPCVVCNEHKPHFHCYKCGSKWMCLKEGCYERWHIALILHRVRNN
jgi:hypothetical protein